MQKRPKAFFWESEFVCQFAVTSVMLLIIKHLFMKAESGIASYSAHSGIKKKNFLLLMEADVLLFGV